MNSFDIQYQMLLKSILQDGVFELNERTGVNIKILPGGFYDFHIRPSEHFPVLSLRDINIKHFIAEIIWFLSAEQDLTKLQSFTKGWNGFADFDNPEKVSNSYGYMWRKHFGRDQLQLAIDSLSKTPSDRQCVVVAWDPAIDALGTSKKPNVPCVPMFTINIINGELNLNTIWRSEDIYFGLPHDIAGFSLLLLILAQKLGVRPGTYHHIITHAHIYENQFENCEILLARKSLQEPIKLELPQFVYDSSQVWNPEMVSSIIDLLKAQYNPQEKLKHVSIAL
jgi:thymidylate synthase